MAIHKFGLDKIIRLASPVARPLLNLRAEARLARAVNIEDLRAAAEARMHPMCFGYLDSGADDELALRRSTEAFGKTLAAIMKRCHANAAGRWCCYICGICFYDIWGVLT